MDQPARIEDKDYLMRAAVQPEALLPYQIREIADHCGCASAVRQRPPAAVHPDGRNPCCLGARDVHSQRISHMDDLLGLRIEQAQVPVTAALRDRDGDM